MNPVKWVWQQITSVFSFLRDDFKSDFEVMQKLAKRKEEGLPLFPQKFKNKLSDYWKNFNLGEFLKDNWIMYLLFALYFVAGWVLASQYYQVQANNFIAEQMGNMAGKVSNNFTLPIGVGPFN